ncbi:MAG: regulatory protein RecX [bacterium]
MRQRKSKEIPRELPLIGKITKLSQVKRDPERVSVYINNIFIGTIYIDRLRELRIEEGIDVNQELAEKLYKQINITLGLKLAMNKLSYRQRSIMEIEIVLRRARIPNEAIAEVIEFLKTRGYLNDGEFAKAFAQEYSKRKAPFGRRAIKSKMITKGIDSELIDRALDEIESDVELARRCMMVGIKRYDKYEPIEKRKRLSQFLYTKGFSWDVIKEVIDEIISNDL